MEIPWVLSIGKLSKKDLMELRERVRIAYFCLFQLWIGSFVGACLYFIVIPENPIYLYFHAKSTANNYIHPVLTYMLGLVLEGLQMYSGWGMILLVNCLNFTVMASVTASARAVTSHVHHGNIPPKDALRSYRILHLVVQRFNDSFANFLALHMTQNIVHFWLIAFQLVRYGSHVPFMMIMIFWANVFYEITKIIVSKVGCDVHSASKEAVRSMKESVGKGCEMKRNWYKRMIWSCRPISFKYGTFCEQRPAVVLELLYVATSNLIVFLKL